MTLFFRRIWAILIRHTYLYLGSWPRFVEMMYWPVINILSWGFTSVFIYKKLTGTTPVSDILVAGVLLSELILRTGHAMLILFLEEVWSRNLGHLFASPIKVSEYTLSLVVAALFRVVVSVTPAMVLTYYLFGFSILSFGWPLAAFVVLLIMSGCWYGLLVLSLIFRYGLAAEWLGWMSVWLFIPFMAPYYPVSILPHAMQVVSWSLPATYVFECMKGMINQTEFRADYLWIALGLNGVYFVIAGYVFYRAYRSAQKRGGILQVGE
jgi:ABC-2 type transport system permease protein